MGPGNEFACSLASVLWGYGLNHRGHRGHREYEEARREGRGFNAEDAEEERGRREGSEGIGSASKRASTGRPYEVGGQVQQAAPLQKRAGVGARGTEPGSQGLAGRQRYNMRRGPAG